MEPWEVMISESQERMVAIVRPQMVEAVERVLDRWELGHSVDRGGDRERRAASVLAGRAGRRDSGALPDRGLPALRRDLRAARRDTRAGDRRIRPESRKLFRPCSRRRTCEAASSCFAATTSSSARGRCAGQGSMLPSSACARRSAVSRSRSTGKGGSHGSIPSPAARSRSSRPPATSPARAGSRSDSPTASTSGTRRSPRSAGSSREAIDGMAAACDALGLPIVSGNVSLYNETNGRAIHPTPVVGAVGLVPDVRRVPEGLARGRLRAARRGLAALARRLGVSGALRSRSAAHPARSISMPRRGSSRSSGRSAPLCSLVHDSSEGGLAVCLAEAAIFSGVRRRADARRRSVGALRRGGRACRAGVCSRGAGGRSPARCRARRAGERHRCRGRRYPPRSGASAPAKRLDDRGDL